MGGGTLFYKLDRGMCGAKRYGFQAILISSEIG